MQKQEKQALIVTGISLVVIIISAIGLSLGAGNDTSNEEQAKSSSQSSMENKNNMYSSAPAELPKSERTNKQAVIDTSKGEVVIKLYGEIAPRTVSNFIFLAKENFYQDLTFHRVDPGFVVQGGDPLDSGQGGPGYTIPAEISEKAKHKKGAVAMARLSDAVNPEKASSGSQFYITLAKAPFLDGEYTVFGEVIKGMEVVEAIEIDDKIRDISIEAIQ